MLTNLIAGCRDAGCDIVGVFRYDMVRYPLIERVLMDLFNPSKEATYIKSHKLYEIKAKSANSAEFKKEVLRLNADIVLVGTWGEKIKKSIIANPKSNGAMPEVKPGGRLGKAFCKAGDSFVTSTSRKRMKMTPNMGPIVVPRPPMIIIPINKTESVNGK